MFNGLDLTGSFQSLDVHRRNADQSGDQDQGRQAGKGRRSVPAQELSHTVEGAGPTGQDRLVVQVSLDVLGQGMGRLVATHPVLLHGPDRDPVQVPAKSARQGSQVRVTGSCELLRFVTGNRAQSCTDGSLTISLSD